MKYKVTPSFYTLHTYTSPRPTSRIAGEEQTAYISPMRDAIEQGLHPTNHTDFVVAPLDQIVHAVDRGESRVAGGRIDRARQRVTPSRL